MSSKNETKIVADPGKYDLTITREFDAPRELVFKAYTDPKLFAQWQGPTGYETTLEKFDARTGGAWRYSQIAKDGNKYSFHGSFHDVSAPERIIQTFEYDGLPEPGHVALESAKFEELPGGRTRVVSHSVFMSVTDRDGMIQSGMETGVNEGYERLDEILAKK